jgi:hypothetical protein
MALGVESAEESHRVRVGQTELWNGEDGSSRGEQRVESKPWVGVTGANLVALSGLEASF